MAVSRVNGGSRGRAVMRSTVDGAAVGAGAPTAARGGGISVRGRGVRGQGWHEDVGLRGAEAGDRVPTRARRVAGDGRVGLVGVAGRDVVVVARVAGWSGGQRVQVIVDETEA